MWWCPPPPRVDGKDVPFESRLEHKRELGDLRRVPPDAKDPRLCRPPRNGIVGHLQEPPDKVGTPPTPPLPGHPLPWWLHWGPLTVSPPTAAPAQVPDGLRDELPSDESLSESGTSQHFAGEGVPGGGGG